MRSREPLSAIAGARSQSMPLAAARPDRALASVIGSRAMGGILARQVAAPLPGCTAAQSQRIRRTRNLAGRMILRARRALEAAPAPGSIEEEALETHFNGPSEIQRRIIDRTFQRIQGELADRNFVCVPSCRPGTQAFWMQSDDLVYACPSFFTTGSATERRLCRAIILIHELAHDVGVDSASRPGHNPNRGTALYPVAGRRSPRHPMTTQFRIFTPDPYAFFAAHLWQRRDVPVDCF